MPRNRFNLEPGDPRYIEVAREGPWGIMTVSLSGQVLGVIPDREHLMQGVEYTLDDGSHISLGFRRGLLGPVLDVKRDGRRLSALSPEQRMKRSALAVYLVGGGTLLWGLLQMASAGLTLCSVITTVVGLLLLALGFATQRGSKVALIIALLLYLVSSVLNVITMAQGRVALPGVPGPSLAVFASCARLMILIWMASGLLPLTRATAANQG